MSDAIEQTEFDNVYDQADADEIVVISMTRRQWWHLDDWRAEHPDRYPKRYAERQAALKAMDEATPLTDFNSSDTPHSGPGSISGHAHEAPHNTKEIA